MTDQGRTGAPSMTEGDRFEIGGENLLAEVRATPEVGDEEPAQRAGRDAREVLADVRIRIGTLLKAETVSFLLGAGTSKDCGGPLIGSLPLDLERALLQEGVSGKDRPRVRRWLKVFYLAVRQTVGGDGAPVSRDAIVARRDKLARAGVESLPANFEQVLARLHRWRSAIPESGGRLRLDGPSPVDVNSEDLDESLKHATRALAGLCNLPTQGKEDHLASFMTLLRKLLTRPLNLKRVNVFTLNYDTLVEQAADAEGVVLLDGFVGTQRRIFRPESYEQDLYFPAETTEGRVHRFDRVLHLYKLHGSITWVAAQSTIENPYGVSATPFEPDGTSPLLIYPTPAKYGETLGMPYAELFRRFASTQVRPQSVLFVIGYGFGDEHVNAIIRQALAVPSFTLVMVDPKPSSDFVARLREQADNRVWVAEGPTLGSFAGFVRHVLPDLRDEEISKKVLATQRALARSGGGEGEADHAG